MENLHEKLKWFNSLPSVRMRNEPVETERTCPCGQTIWYEGCELTLAVESWIEIHFEHGSDEAGDGEISIGGDEYDFTRPIKFSKAGFDRFVERFGLRKNLTTIDHDWYTDERGRRFLFHRRYTEKMPPSDYEGVFVIFDCAASQLETCAE